MLLRLWRTLAAQTAVTAGLGMSTRSVETRTMCSSRSSWRRPSSTSTCSSVTSTSSAPTSGSLTLRRTPFQFEEWTPYIVPTPNSECDPPQSLGLFSNFSRVECDEEKNKIFPIPTQRSTGKHLCLLVTFWWQPHSSSNLLPMQLQTYQVQAQNVTMTENALREQQTPNCDHLSPLPTTTGPNNNVKLFLPNVSSRIFLFLLFPYCLFPSVISISGQYRYVPPKIEVLIIANRLRNPFLSSFLANTNILQKKKNFKCFSDSWDSFAAAKYGHSTFCKKKEAGRKHPV